MSSVPERHADRREAIPEGPVHVHAEGGGPVHGADNGHAGHGVQQPVRESVPAGNGVQQTPAAVRGRAGQIQERQEGDRVQLFELAVVFLVPVLLTRLTRPSDAIY